tara:strand:+ start:608 stop:931 length:324 start_codon:yes stop_codon:yes gene_type:complete
MVIYKLLLITNFILGKSFITNNNVILQLKKDVASRRKHTPLMVYNSTSNKVEEPDIIEKYSNWFGWFPPEKKWKSVRFTIYAIAGGYILSEGVQNVIEFSKAPNLDF